MARPRASSEKSVANHPNSDLCGRKPILQCCLKWCLVHKDAGVNESHVRLDALFDCRKQFEPQYTPMILDVLHHVLELRDGCVVQEHGCKWAVLVFDIGLPSDPFHLRQDFAQQDILILAECATVRDTSRKFIPEQLRNSGDVSLLPGWRTAGEAAMSNRFNGPALTSFFFIPLSDSCWRSEGPIGSFGKPSSLNRKNTFQYDTFGCRMAVGWRFFSPMPCFKRWMICKAYSVVSGISGMYSRVTNVCRRRVRISKLWMDGIWPNLIPQS
ncbi:hypothetical protein DFS34DRAFT_267319 [Phlyctochytrium arcticum]|nr:hypothetical protein DFS34DRAFT_267319 [Phlyctochytrium arcticum]